MLRKGNPSALRARVRDEAVVDWTDVGAPSSPASDIAQWSVSGLAPGRRYAYQVLATGGGQERTLYAGSAVTTRAPGASFNFALIADSHIEPPNPIPDGTTIVPPPWDFEESTLLSVASDIQQGNPDFMLSLGDMLDYHIFGFDDPPPDSSWARLGYLDYRRMLGDTLGHTADWPGESETGKARTAATRGRKSSARAASACSISPGPSRTRTRKAGA